MLDLPLKYQLRHYLFQERKDDPEIAYVFESPSMKTDQKVGRPKKNSKKAKKNQKKSSKNDNTDDNDDFDDGQIGVCGR